jgi:outer membrane lipoprotein
MRAIILVAATALLLGAGCATAPFPAELTRTVDRGVTLKELRAEPKAHTGARVILGGDIVATVPKPGETEIEVLSRRLGGGDVPERGDRTDGRFLVRTREFLDPAVYASGRRLTVLGTVAGVEERRVGELPYSYPVINAERIKLWPAEAPWVGGEYPPLDLGSPILPPTR